MSKELDALKKKALMSLELSPDKKSHVTASELTTFVQKLKSEVAKKEIVLIALQK